MAHSKIDNDRATLLDLLTKEPFTSQDASLVQEGLERAGHINPPLPRHIGTLDDKKIVKGIVDFLNKNPLYAPRVNQEIRAAIHEFSANDEGLLKTPKFPQDARYETVTSYLGKDYPLDSFENKGLQTKLGIKAPDGELGSVTVTKILNHLEAHPKDFAKIGLPILHALMEQEGDADRLAKIARKSPEYFARVQTLWASESAWPTNANAKTYNLQILLQTGGLLSALQPADGGFGDKTIAAIDKFEKLKKPDATLTSTFSAAKDDKKSPSMKNPHETPVNAGVSSKHKSHNI